MALPAWPNLGLNPKCAQNGWPPMHLQDGERMLTVYPDRAAPSVGHVRASLAPRGLSTKVAIGATYFQVGHIRCRVFSIQA